MTGPEHYQAAEQLLKQVTSLNGIVSEETRHANTIAAAQAHFTAALAAATALSSTADGMDGLDRAAWDQAAGVQA